MATERVLFRDPISGVTTYHSVDDGKRYIRTSQDVNPILDWNQAERYDGRGKACEKGRIGMKVARIPLALIMKWKEEEGVDFFSSDPGMREKIAQKLNSEEFRKLRIAEMNL